jgi:hypothetical protein
MTTVYETRRGVYDPNLFTLRFIEAKIAEIDIDNGILFSNNKLSYSFDEY